MLANYPASKALINTQLQPMYLLIGEPVLVNVTLDQVVALHKKQGFSIEKRVIADDDKIDPQPSLSLFDERQLQVFYCDQRKQLKPYEDAMAQNCNDRLHTLVTLPEYKATDKRQKWYQAFEKEGVVVQHFPLQKQQLSQYLHDQCELLSLSLSSQQQRWITDACDDDALVALNLLRQLKTFEDDLLMGAEILSANIPNHSIYKLIEALFQKNQKAFKTAFDSVQKEYAPTYLLYLLLQEITDLIELHHTPPAQKAQYFQSRRLFGPRKTQKEIAARHFDEKTLRRMHHTFFLLDQQSYQMNVDALWSQLWETMSLFLASMAL